MSRQYIFIDDSGDPGIKGSNTTHFIVAAVLVVNRENLIRLSAAIEGFRAGLHWDELHELKFRMTEKKIIRNFLQFIRQFEFSAYAAVIDKTKMTNMPRLSSGENLYNYAIKELLLRLRLSEPIIVVDGSIGKKHAMKTRTYLRQAMKQYGMMKCEIGFADSRKEPMIQLADIVAGSVARSFDKAKADRNDYAKLLEAKIEDIYEINL